MSDADFERDAGAVLADLLRLKARLEPASLGHLHEYVLTVDGEVPSQQRYEEDEW